ncbi:alpha-amylase, partial [bacterium]|nr:alpha-amylase [bacterium]
MDERKFHLLFGVHNHQPVGNFPQVFEEGYKKAYLPFIEVLERHPEVKVSLHYSGSLWEWIESEHPHFLKRIKDLLEKGQIEILGGGFYEPLLPLIPLKDVKGQIGMMNDF